MGEGEKGRRRSAGALLMHCNSEAAITHLRPCLALLVLAACAAPPAVETMLVLERVSRPEIDTITWASSIAAVAVSETGDIAVLDSGVASVDALTILSSTGVISGKVARGPGPGHLSGNGRLFATSAGFTVADSVNERLVRISRAGAVVAEWSLAADVLVLSAEADSIDLMPLADVRQRGLLRRSLNDGGTRVLLPPSDPFLVEWLSRHGPTSYGNARVPYGTDGSEAVLGDAYSYRLMRFDVGSGSGRIIGRDLPSRHRTDAEHRWFAERFRRVIRPGHDSLMLEQELESTRAQVLPHFGPNGLFIDDAGRTVVVGSTRDSTFVDSFADGVHLGRAMLECRNHDEQVSLNGLWLLLACRTQVTDDSASVTLQLYRIQAGS